MEANEETISRFRRTHFGQVASAYLSPYVRNSRTLDTVFGIRRDETYGTFMIGDSSVMVDEVDDVTESGVIYEGTEGLWELLTKKKVDHSLIMPADMNACKRIFESTEGHLRDNASLNNYKTTRGPKYRNAISRLFSTAAAATTTLNDLQAMSKL